jgi:hypothetical protein
MKENKEIGVGKFRKVVEDFECFRCHAEVKGSGYTDHCPNCLWSLHVDNNPGDRKSDCRGKMKPVSAAYENGSYIISYLCTKCGIRRRFKAAEKDNEELLLELIGSRSK